MASEWLYRSGGVLAIERLRLRPGDQVLDIGCGTGLNFALLRERFGSHGVVGGVDSSGQMLEQAQRRAQERGWSKVTLVHADAAKAELPSSELRAMIYAYPTFHRGVEDAVRDLH